MFTAGFTKGMKNPICFVAGTMILTAMGLKAIETIKIGDMVISTNTDTMESGAKVVLQTFVNETKELVHIMINGEKISTTPGHMFYDVIKGWTPAITITHGDVLLLKDNVHMEIDLVTYEQFDNPIKVYNFEVADWHTYRVGNGCVLVHNDCSYKINDNGDIEVTDWKYYPEGQPTPEGPLKLIDGDEYIKLRKEANNANRNIHNSNPSLKGIDIHEVKPVKWGGSPTDLSNKIPLTRSEHVKLTGWWKTFQSAVEKNSK